MTKIGLVLALGLTIVFTGYSCKGKKSGDSATAGAGEKKAVVNVTTGQSIAREVPSYISATGSLVADETSDVAPKVAGKVTNVYVNVGGFVSAGSAIAKIDDKDAKLRLSEADAGVKQSQAAVRQAEARIGLSPNGKFNSSSIPEVRQANAVYEQNLAELRQAEANEKRYRDLVETGDVSMVMYEGFRTTRDTARARAKAAKEALDSAANNARQNNAAITSAKASVDTAKAQLLTAKQAVADTIIYAPFSGYISERQVAVGEYVTSSTPVIKLLRTNPIKIYLQVSETDLPQVGIGSGISVEVDAYKDRRFAGRVSAINPALDTSSRAATVEGTIENSNNALRSGMFATSRITRQGGNTGIFVPKAAVYRDVSTQSYRVFVIKENIVKLRVVELGEEEDDYYLINSGVDADELVATSNLDQLYEGAKVSY
ncbi:MAG: efflux RND transporter periplasmic adaptor subunit [Pyrinomonadaceae bacterium]